MKTGFVIAWLLFVVVFIMPLHAEDGKLILTFNTSRETDVYKQFIKENLKIAFNSNEADFKSENITIFFNEENNQGIAIVFKPFYFHIEFSDMIIRNMDDHLILTKVDQNNYLLKRTGKVTNKIYCELTIGKIVFDKVFFNVTTTINNPSGNQFPEDIFIKSINNFENSSKKLESSETNFNIENNGKSYFILQSDSYYIQNIKAVQIGSNIEINIRVDQNTIILDFLPGNQNCVIGISFDIEKRKESVIIPYYNISIVNSNRENDDLVFNNIKFYVDGKEISMSKETHFIQVPAINNSSLLEIKTEGYNINRVVPEFIDEKIDIRNAFTNRNLFIITKENNLLKDINLILSFEKIEIDNSKIFVVLKNMSPNPDKNWENNISLQLSGDGIKKTIKKYADLDYFTTLISKPFSIELAVSENQDIAVIGYSVFSENAFEKSEVKNNRIQIENSKNKSMLMEIIVKVTNRLPILSFGIVASPYFTILGQSTLGNEFSWPPLSIPHGFSIDFRFSRFLLVGIQGYRYNFRPLNALSADIKKDVYNIQLKGLLNLLQFDYLSLDAGADFQILVRNYNGYVDYIDSLGVYINCGYFRFRPIGLSLQGYFNLGWSTATDSPCYYAAVLLSVSYNLFN